MNNKKLPIVLVSISCILLLIAIILIVNRDQFKLSNRVDSDNDISTNVKTKTDTNVKTKTDVKTDTNVKTEVVTEDDVVTYFKDSETSLKEDSLKDKAKDSFVTVIDFIFYDKQIKGHTFKDLTTSAKLKIIKVALTIDNKIDKYFPDYKDTIKDKYTSIKGKLALKYLEVTSSLCDEVGESTCNQAKEDFNSMKASFSFTWELIKELASSGSTKVKNFYETWRDSE